MDLLTKGDVCRELGISERGLEKMVMQGRFPEPVRLGKRAVWSPVALERWREAVFEEQERWQRR